MFFRAVSKHPSPVAINFVYELMSPSVMENTTDGARLCADSKYSSANDIRSMAMSCTGSEDDEAFRGGIL